MNFSPLKIITLAYLFSSSLYIPSVNATDNLPPILDYYPNCSYKIIEYHLAKVITEQPLAEQTALTLLTKLRRKAKDRGADALILINKDVNKAMSMDKFYGQNTANATKFIVSYEAELIKGCKVVSRSETKATPYNHKGYQVKKGMSSSITIQTKVVFTPPTKAKLNHPIITNNELSLVNGIYGINIGLEYQQVIDKFGEPSIVLSMTEGLIITGYGRSHWLHFQNNKLVKVQSKLSIVSPVLLNMVPLRDFFDKTPWVLATKIARQSSFLDVKTAMMMDMKLNSQKEVVIKGKENSLILAFGYRQLSEDNDKNYFLEDFSLESNSYIETKSKVENKREGQFDSLRRIIANLNQGNSIDLGLLKSVLGQPFGRITVSATSYIDIYNENLLVEIKRAELVSIQLLDELFRIKGDLSTKTPWYLGDFVQGKSIKDLDSFFPADIYKLDNMYEIDSEEYQLTLFFDDSDENNTLYEAKVTMY
ncbi:hypothetical protein [Colwellia sp. 12G3]|uniref:hypothetical protein n=1 Tax=Colwellia sp. 12G3 TaxID=2058299 RepID=UPI0012FF02B1|nr:hypothetical protein [Colwellia sp. 12G3]